MRLIIRVLLSALAFTTVLPMIHGFSFHGSFLIALAISVMFGIMLWAVETLTIAIAALWTIGSLGIALLWLIPMWILGFWLLPVLALILTADVVPQNLAISGFQPAALAGVVLLFICLLTSKFFWPDRQGRAH
jgi:uncharacterized membrane protein YvlD (DUF360 family)